MRESLVVGPLVSGAEFFDFPEGIARNTFATITSMMPGTVPCGEIDGVLEYHCLDIREPVVEALWAEERRLARALTAGRRHG